MIFWYSENNHDFIRIQTRFEMTNIINLLVFDFLNWTDTDFLLVWLTRIGFETLSLRDHEFRDRTFVFSENILNPGNGWK